jgi:hypothetical protein
VPDDAQPTRDDLTAAIGARRGAPARHDPGLTLGVVSVIAGIPVTAITTSTSGLAALIVAWGGIAAWTWLMHGVVAAPVVNRALADVA